MADAKELSADEEEAGRLTGDGGRGAVDAGGDGAAVVEAGDFPEVTDAEGPWASAGERLVVEVEEVFVEEVEEALVIRAAVEVEQLSAGGGVVDAAHGVGVLECLRGGTGVGAEPCVGFVGGAVDVP